MMIGRSTRRKKEHFGSEARCSWYEKKWINAFLKRLALIDLASTNIKDGTAREEICKTIKGYRKLVPDLRDKAAWPDAKLPFIVKSSIRSLELSVAVIQFGLDSLRLSLHLAMLYRNQEVHVFPAFLLGCGSLLTLTVFLVLPATWQLSAMWSGITAAACAKVFARTLMNSAKLSTLFSASSCRPAWWFFSARRLAVPGSRFPLFRLAPILACGLARRGEAAALATLSGSW